MGKIILLNGCSSSGKTSIAQAIQGLCPTPWLRLGVDTLIDMMPSAYIALGEKAKEGYFACVPEHQASSPLVHIATTSRGRGVFDILPFLVKMLATLGESIVIEEVFTEKACFRSYQAALSSFPVYFVGVHCPLSILQAREKRRKDRLLGLAHGQFYSVHAGYTYEIGVDTSSSSPLHLADAILSHIASNPSPSPL